jgi:protein-S-isoprenylcysteine O-methyltransferase Ste14
LFALGLQYALYRWLPGPQLVPEGYRSAGSVIFALGTLLIVSCAVLFYRYRTPIEPGAVSQALIVRGPYRWSRNPIYVGMTIMLCGSAVRFGNLTAFLPVVGFVWVISTRFIVMEESMLRERFAGEYEAYCVRVRRWL